MEVSVDLDNVEEFVTSNKFRDFILVETTDFGTAAFIMQSLLDAVKKAKDEMKET